MQLYKDSEYLHFCETSVLSKLLLHQYVCPTDAFHHVQCGLQFCQNGVWQPSLMYAGTQQGNIEVNIADLMTIGWIKVVAKFLSSNINKFHRCIYTWLRKNILHLKLTYKRI